jgi:hypothetical protein
MAKTEKNCCYGRLQDRTGRPRCELSQRVSNAAGIGAEAEDRSLPGVQEKFRNGGISQGRRSRRRHVRGERISCGQIVE